MAAPHRNTITKIRDNWALVALILGALTAIIASLQEYLATDKTPTWREMATAAGIALMTYVMKRPGDLTKEQAEEHATKAVRESQLPPLAEEDEGE